MKKKGNSVDRDKLTSWEGEYGDKVKRKTERRRRQRVIEIYRDGLSYKKRRKMGLKGKWRERAEEIARVKKNIIREREREMKILEDWGVIENRKENRDGEVKNDRERKTERSKYG